jgi:uncharacterized membrane protein
MHHQPQGAAFDIVLLFHVGCVVVGLATMTTSAATATRLRRVLPAASDLPDALQRYFRPGVNWPARAVYGIPVFGVALLAMSGGAYSLRQGWVTLGIGVFIIVVLLGEGVLWPAERRLQVALGPTPADAVPAAPDAIGHDARIMALTAAGCLVLLVIGSAIMVAQP